MKPSISAWSKFREEARRSPQANQYEPLEAGTWSSLELFVPQKAPRALLLFTKPFLCKRWFESQTYPETLFSMVHGGIPTASYWRSIRDIAKRVRLPLCFVGDLDPFDLTTFLALRSGDPDLRRPDHRALPIRYVGIDDAWLKICERHLLPEMTGALPYFRMSALELKHRDLVLRMAPWLLDLVGQRCAELFRSGMKIELEGASNPSLYNRGFLSALRVHLLRRCARHVQDPESLIHLTPAGRPPRLSPRRPCVPGRRGPRSSVRRR